MPRCASWLALAAIVASSGCTKPGILVAESGEHRLTARDPVSGITVIATTGVWNGDPYELEDEATVVHILVANMGSEPIVLAPGDLELRDLRGFRYDVLDPGGTFVERSQAETPYARTFRARYDLGRDPEHVEGIVAGGDIAELALPWGILLPGTQMRGFIYFEEMTPQANGATLTWHIPSARGRDLVDATFELRVARR